MRPEAIGKRIVALVAAWLALGLAACGGGATTATTSRPANPAGETPATAPTTTRTTSPPVVDSKPDPDQDGDRDPGGVGPLDTPLDFGHAADAADRHTIATIVKRYYAIALAGEGAKACAMLVPPFAEAAAEDYGARGGGPPYMFGVKTCPELLTRVFSHEHSQLAVQLPHLRVAYVRVHEHHAVAVISFAPLPDMEIKVQRVAGRWFVGQLLGNPLP